MKDIVFANKDKFLEKKERIIEDGFDNLFVVSDFDRTLTKAFHNGQKVSSLISILREQDYLGQEYMQRARALFDEYHQYEIDMEISFEEKDKKMTEWWSRHNDMFVEYGLSMDMINDIVKKHKAGLRGGAIEMFQLLKEEDVPLLIASASGLGMAIDDYLEKNGVYFDNTKIITNYFDFNEKGVVIRAKEPVVTTTNKFKIINQHLAEIETRHNKEKNIILLGDNYEDEKMADGLHYADILKIGYLNENVDENIDDYKMVFDVVILNDSNLDFANNFLKDLK